VPASAASTSKYALTIYSDDDTTPLFAGPADYDPPAGYALVFERRTVNTGEGPGTLTLTGFPRYLDATALTTSLEHGLVSSQRFEAEPLRSESILERGIGRQVVIEQSSDGQVGTLTGELLSSSVPLALRLEDGSIVSVNDYSRIRFPSPSAGISATPQLRLGVDATYAGEQVISLSYPTAGLAWRAEYVAQLKSVRDCRVDFSGYAQIVNRSGHGFPAARVKLVAGQPFRASVVDSSTRDGADESLGTALDQYRLDHAVDIPDGSSQQVALFAAERDLRCVNELLYVGQPLRAQPWRVPITEPAFGRGGERTVRSTLSFRPGATSPIPAGRVRVLAEDEIDGTLELMVEQSIARTPASQSLDIVIADAHELRGSRIVSDFKVDESGLGIDETITIRLENTGDTSASVRVREHLYRWTTWRIIEQSRPFERRDDDTIEFLANVPAKGDVTMNYRVRYSWTEHFQ
jgi:hypothetical protein